MGIVQCADIGISMKCDKCNYTLKKWFLLEDSLEKYCKDNKWKKINGKWLCPRCFNEKYIKSLSWRELANKWLNEIVPYVLERFISAYNNVMTVYNINYFESEARKGVKCYFCIKADNKNYSFNSEDCKNCKVNHICLKAKDCHKNYISIYDNNSKIITINEYKKFVTKAKRFFTRKFGK